MRPNHVLPISLSLAVIGLLALNPSAQADAHWPAWRGASASGAAAGGNPPMTWGESENIKWKVEIPGRGSSTPVVWGDKLFVQTAVSTEDAPVAEDPAQERGLNAPAVKAPLKFNVVCFDRGTGKILWERTAREELPHERTHPTGSYASHSPVTDGSKLWVSFGSRGLYCYDLDGNPLWARELMKLNIKREFGEASSPALAGDAIVVLMDHEGQSKIAAYNKDTGEPLWESDRDEGTTWTSPFPVSSGDSLQVVTSGSNRIRSYDVKTGDLLWDTEGLTMNVIPTPVAGFGMVYCTSGFRASSLKAIELGHSGDLTETGAIKWEVAQGTPYVSSPLLYEDRIYFVDGLNPELSCYDAKTGDPIIVKERIEGLGQIYASPSGAGGRIYLADREGKVVVLKKSDTLEILATNSLDDGFDASPIFVGDELYLKGQKFLYCIASS